MRKMERDYADNFPCKKCGARVGEPCRRVSDAWGQVAYRRHSERVRDAQAEAQRQTTDVR